MTWCDYAACHSPAQHKADGWEFCTPHLRAHEQLSRIDASDRRADTEADIKARRKLTAYRRSQVARLWRKGWNDSQIARSLGLHRNSVATIRRSLNLPARVRSAECGTRSGAARHRSRGERPCEDCARADREYDTNYKRLQRMQQQTRAQDVA